MYINNFSCLLFGFSLYYVGFYVRYDILIYAIKFAFPSAVSVAMLIKHLPPKDFEDNYIFF